MLTPLELDIMKAVWKNSPITVRSVQESIRPERPLAYTTVMTIMDRLYHKGILHRKLHSRTHYYEPAVEYTAVRNEALENLIRSFFGTKENLQEFLSGDEVPIPGRPNGPSASPSGLDETLL
jgi:predicted transcriptional regulator